MNKIMLGLILVVVLLCGSSEVQASAAGGASTYTYQDQTKLTTWLWNTAEIVDHPDQIIQNLHANHVTQLHLQIDSSINAAYYRTFIRAASAQGIQVNALDGAPEWAGDEGKALQQAFLSWLKDYQQKASAEERFAGIHLDVEPYELEQYADRPDVYLEAYQAMIIRFKNQAAKQQLNFSIDIPFWFYGVTYKNDSYGSGNLAQWLCRQVKAMTIMAYRDKAQGEDSILSIAAAEMKMFKQNGVEGTIAVETGRLSDSYQFVTFYEESKDYMNEQLEIVYQNYKSHAEFNGFAIHYYDSWMAMK